MVLCRSDGLRAYELPSLKLLRTIPGMAEVQAIAISRDGRQIVAWLPDDLRSINISTGFSTSFSGFNSAATAAPKDEHNPFPSMTAQVEAISPTGRYAVVAAGSILYIQDVEKNRISTLHAAFKPFRMAFSADDRFLGISTPYYTGGATLFDLESGRELPVVTGPVDDLSVGSDMQDKPLVLIGRDPDGSNRSYNRRLSPYATSNGRTFTPQGGTLNFEGTQQPTRLVTSSDGRVLAWNSRRITSLQPDSWTLYASEEADEFQSVSVFKDLSVVIFGGGCVTNTEDHKTTCRNATLKILYRGRLRYWLDLPSPYADAAIVDKGSRLVVATPDDVWIADLLDDWQEETLRHDGQIQSVILGSDFLASVDSLANVLFRKGNVITRLTGTAIAVNPKGRVLAVAGPNDGKVTLHFLDENQNITGRSEVFETSYPGQIFALALSPDDKRIAFSGYDPFSANRTGLVIADLSTRKELCKEILPQLDRLVWSPKANLLGTDGVETHGMVAVPFGCARPPYYEAWMSRSVAGFSSDGTYMVMGGPSLLGGPSVLVNVDNPEADLSRNKDYPFGPVAGNLEIEAADKAAFSDDASLVAVATTSGAVYIMERATHKVIQTVEARDRVLAMGFSADQRFLRIVSGDSELRLNRYFVFRAQQLLDEACRRSTRKNLSAEEWDSLAGPSRRTTTCSGVDGISIPDPR